MTNDRKLFWLIIGMLAFIVFCLMARHAPAHEHQAGETSEQARIVQFYKTWLRPKGDFSIQHRVSSCCWAEGAMQDCFPVKETKRDTDGTLLIKLDVDQAHAGYGLDWYKVDHNIEEHKQPDPRESPDGRSHACVSGNVVICYVQGVGS